MKKIFLSVGIICGMLLLTSCNKNTDSDNQNRIMQQEESTRTISATENFTATEGMNLIEKKIIESKDFIGKDFTVELYANGITKKEEQIGMGGVAWTMLVKDGDKTYILLDKEYIKDELTGYYPVVNMENNDFLIAVSTMHISVGISIREFRYDPEKEVFNEYWVYRFPGNPNILNMI
jgi:hypothetical protein